MNLVQMVLKNITYSECNSKNVKLGRLQSFQGPGMRSLFEKTNENKSGTLLRPLKASLILLGIRVHFLRMEEVK